MSLKISSWAIAKPTPIVLLFLLLSLAGIVAFNKLPVAGDPRVELPIISVDVAQPGATPQELETNVARRLEEGLAGLPGLNNLSTTIANGQVSITAEFQLEANIDRAASDVRDAVSRIRPELPAQIGEPLVTRVDVSGWALQSFSVSAEGVDEMELSRRIDEQLGPKLLGVTGVQQFKRLGGAKRELRIELDPARLSAAGVSVAELARQLQLGETNIPAGTVRDGDERMRPLRVLGASTDAQTLAKRLVTLDKGRSIALGELGRVVDEGNEPNGFALLNGQPVLVLEVYKKRGASELKLAEGVARALDEYRQAHPEMRIELFEDNVEFTRMSYGGARDTLLEGALLTVLVVWFFLRDWRATLLAAAAIPLSLLPTFVAMHWRGFQLDSVTLLALILVIGILVDDAIVEIENIARRIENGEAPREAAGRGADALGLSVVAITMTIVAVFLPVSFIGGVVGKYFTEFGLTTTFAVLASLCVARLVTPMMCARWMRPHHGGEVAPGRMQLGYLRLLDWVMRHRRASLGTGGCLLLATFGLLSLLPSGFMPETRPQAIPVYYELPPGASLRQSVQAAEQLRAAIAGVPDIAGVFAYERGSPDQGALRLQLAPPGERRLAAAELEQQLRERLARVPDLRANLLLGGWAKDLSLSFVSADPGKLEPAMLRLLREATELPLLQDLGLDQGRPLTSLDLRLRPEAAARLGVDASTLADAMRLATLGASDTALPRIVIDGKLVAVRLRLAGGQALAIEALRQLPIPTGNGGVVALETVATIEPGSTPSSLNRLNRERVIQLQANLAPGVSLSEAIAAIEALPAYRELPPGVRLAPYGDAQHMNEMFERFAMAALFGLVAVYAVLVLLFDDWLQPLSIMLALPLALSGASIALLLGGHSLNLSTVIGLLMLFGIVAKNSILLVDFIIEARRDGQGLDEAITQAGRERVRPIVMTTLAMVGGMLPAALGWGHDDGFRAPMAVAVIGGLISSTLLSLLFVPLVYRQLEQLRRRLSGKKKQEVNKEEQAC
ncbi:efflux RND transporter permease subunit [Paucibacter sp. XJ19-41]|uniref:efflux RND transporter permease subunit n=1 Tax=Paucibacter sp. XJ19-41 TaxID=2927824 RepID=UPI00234A5BCC|nr:efflux RND transporter permease subunit [Paucibacter sp. XJ19-41]MDC6171056.1 efflux RND transporter permease subunit [Paucibacter sp. XJ19-41]